VIFTWAPVDSINYVFYLIQRFIFSNKFYLLVRISAAVKTHLVKKPAVDLISTHIKFACIRPLEGGVVFLMSISFFFRVQHAACYMQPDLSLNAEFFVASYSQVFNFISGQ